MGIYIPNMEMPKTCVQCDLKIYDPEMRWDENGIKQIGAWVCKRTRELIWNTQRGENCPLVPLPEGHGRLIDGDALFEKMYRLSDNEGAHKDSRVDDALILRDSACYLIEDAPTIVPAEGGGEDG